MVTRGQVPARAARPGAAEPGEIRPAAFVDSHYRGVFRYFLWMGADPDAAADLTQETFAGFWESLERGAPLPEPERRAWLYAVARNRWRKRCRAAAAPEESLDQALELPDPRPCPEAAVIGSLAVETVLAALEGLPRVYREALVLRVLQELGYSEVAAALGVREPLARWRVHRARSLLAERLGAVRREPAGGADG